MPSSLVLLTLGGFLLGVLTFVHVVICVILISVVLLQQKGSSADLASAFGAGPAQANVAALSAEDIVTKATKWGAVLFMATSLVLALFPPGRHTSAIDTVPDDAPAVGTSAEPGIPPGSESGAASEGDEAAAPADAPAAEAVTTPQATESAPPPAE